MYNREDKQMRNYYKIVAGTLLAGALTAGSAMGADAPAEKPAKQDYKKMLDQYNGGGVEKKEDLKSRLRQYINKGKNDKLTTQILGEVDVTPGDSTQLKFFIDDKLGRGEIRYVSEDTGEEKKYTDVLVIGNLKSKDGRYEWQPRAGFTAGDYSGWRLGASVKDNKTGLRGGLEYRTNSTDSKSSDSSTETQTINDPVVGVIKVDASTQAMLKTKTDSSEFIMEIAKEMNTKYGFKEVYFMLDTGSVKTKGKGKTLSDVSVDYANPAFTDTKTSTTQNLEFDVKVEYTNLQFGARFEKGQFKDISPYLRVTTVTANGNDDTSVQVGVPMTYQFKTGGKKGLQTLIAHPYLRFADNNNGGGMTLTGVITNDSDYGTIIATPMIGFDAGGNQDTAYMLGTRVTFAPKVKGLSKLHVEHERTLEKIAQMPVSADKKQELRDQEERDFEFKRDKMVGAGLTEAGIMYTHQGNNSWNLELDAIRRLNKNWAAGFEVEVGEKGGRDTHKYGPKVEWRNDDNTLEMDLGIFHEENNGKNGIGVEASAGYRWGREE